MDESKPEHETEGLISAAEPYRAPAAVSDLPKRSSRMGWLAVLGILLGAGIAVGYTRIATNETATEHVSDFGYGSRKAIGDDDWNRRGRIEEPEFIDGSAEIAPAP